jgi:hypothetical protein
MDQFTKINGNHNRKKAMGNGVTVVFFEKWGQATKSSAPSGSAMTEGM